MNDQAPKMKATDNLSVFTYSFLVAELVLLGEHASYIQTQKLAWKNFCLVIFLQKLLQVYIPTFCDFLLSFHVSILVHHIHDILQNDKENYIINDIIQFDITSYLFGRALI